MPGLDGVATIRALASRGRSPRAVALTTFDDDELVLEALRAGAVGYLLKDSPLDDLIQAIRAAAEGETFLQPSVATKVVAELVRRGAPPASAAGRLPNLSERELEVLRELALGASNRQIAARLGLAEGTVKNLVSAILEKLDVPDRTNAALRAREAGLA
jgi:DNA-binding NarL/FixJ family response regulator